MRVSLVAAGVIGLALATAGCGGGGSGSGCTRNSDCNEAIGEICLDRECFLPECRDDADCANPRKPKCSNYACVYQCVEDTDCNQAAGELCIDHECHVLPPDGDRDGDPDGDTVDGDTEQVTRLGCDEFQASSCVYTTHACFDMERTWASCDSQFQQDVYRISTTLYFQDGAWWRFYVDGYTFEAHNGQRYCYKLYISPYVDENSVVRHRFQYYDELENPIGTMEVDQNRGVDVTCAGGGREYYDFLDLLDCEGFHHQMLYQPDPLIEENLHCYARPADGDVDGEPPVDGDAASEGEQAADGDG